MSAKPAKAERARPAGASESSAPLGEAAYRRLRDAIDSGVFRPGDRMRETELSTWLGMSRTPTREAMQRLEARGLLTHAPHRGMVVATLDHQMIAELYTTRETLEAAAAGLAARHASEAEIDALEDLLDQQRQMSANVDWLAKHNRRFHQTLYRAAHNRYLLAALDTLRDSMALLGTSTLQAPGRSDSALEEHAAIVTGIREHDPERAEAAARQHIRAAHRLRLRQHFERLDEAEASASTED